IVVKTGRYGPYVSHDGVNATLPSDLTPETITLEQAVGLLEARSARGGKKPAAAKPSGTSPKSAAKAKAPAQPKAPAKRPARSASARNRRPKAGLSNNAARLNGGYPATWPASQRSLHHLYFSIVTPDFRIPA